MLQTVPQSEADLTVLVRDQLAEAELEDLIGLLSASPDSCITIELSRTRQIEPHALVRLAAEVVRQARLGRQVLLRGLTLSQARLIEMAR